MDGWRQVTEGLWRREADLPIGRAVAEIRKRDYISLYDIRVAVTFAGARLPQTMAKTAIALRSLTEAMQSCNGLVRELGSARYPLLTGDLPV